MAHFLVGPNPTQSNKVELGVSYSCTGPEGNNYVMIYDNEAKAATLITRGYSDAYGDAQYIVELTDMKLGDGTITAKRQATGSTSIWASILGFDFLNSVDAYRDYRVAVQAEGDAVRFTEGSKGSSLCRRADVRAVLNPVGKGAMFAASEAKKYSKYSREPWFLLAGKIDPAGPCGGTRNALLFVVKSNPFSTGVYSLTEKLLADAERNGCIGDKLFPVEVNGAWPRDQTMANFDEAVRSAPSL